MTGRYLFEVVLVSSNDLLLCPYRVSVSL